MTSGEVIIDLGGFDVTVDNTPVPVELDVSAVAVEVDPSPTVGVVTVGGPQGGIGPPGTNSFIFGEIPAPSPPDGVTDVFTLANDFTTGTVQVFRNGLVEIGVSETPPDQITFDVTPLPTDTIVVNYQIS
jgi:hypothetical protein